MLVLNFTRAREVLKRSYGEEEVPQAMLDKIQHTFGQALTPAQVVEHILQDVRQNGDAALKHWTAKLDGVELESVQVDPETIAHASIDLGLSHALDMAIERVRAFHQKQPAHGWLEHTSEGALGQMVRPMSRVGVYVPGGSAPLISTLIMTAVIAKVAGVPEIVVVTPPERGTGKVHPAILYVAQKIGVQAVFAVGGAQAIAALAYGTESIPAVDKIVGPGNTFVTLAKRLVFGQVGIESLAGPTETLVIADHTANVRFVVADLLAQAEHIGAEPVLVCMGEDIWQNIATELDKQLAALPQPNQAWATDSVAQRMKVAIVDTVEQAFELANIYAPEHLCLLFQNPWEHLDKVVSAGGVFIGEDSMEALGDYIAGPSHVMPTGGTARFSSPLNVRDFQKVISVVGVNRKALHNIGAAGATIARAENLEAHARAIDARLQ